MATICLYGNLSQFGHKIKLDVKDTAEAVRLLTSQLPEFKSMLQKGYYRLRIDKQDTDTSNVSRNMQYKLHDKSVIHIVPVLIGAKEGGLFGFIAGAIITVAGVWFGQAWAVQLGIGLMVGGVATMLTPVPDTGGDANHMQSERSTSFSSLDNMTPQGRPVPLCYGEIMTGSLVVAQQLETFDEEIA